MPDTRSFHGCKLDTDLSAPSINDHDAYRQRLADALSILKPKPCPYKMIRLGGKLDGAYLLPDDLANIEACFSPGVDNFKNFEDQLTLDHRIACHMCDKSSDVSKFKTPLIEPGQTFEQSWLDVVDDEDSISLATWVNKHTNSTSSDLILQMDIEGAEYRNILSTTEALLQRFRIIVIELHDLTKLEDIEVFNQVLYPSLKRVDQFFLCVHAHPNNCCGEAVISEHKLNIPRVHELTFLRKDRLSGFDKDQLHPVMLPHPLDIKRNVPNTPPLFLREGWLSSERPSESKIKILEDKLDYQEHLNRMQKDESRLRKDISRLTKMVEVRDRKITNMQKSSSWKLSAPVRFLGKLRQEK